MKILVTGAWQCTKAQLAEIEHLGHEVLFQQQEADDLCCPYEDIEGLICNGLFLYHPIEKFTRLKYIQLTSAGYDRVPMDYVREHGIEIHNAGSVYSIPMAEFALCGVLQLYKQSRFFVRNQADHQWEKRRDLLELYGKKVCIVGCGSVGTECAKRFRAFGCHITGVNRSVRQNDSFDSIVTMDCIDEVTGNCDIAIMAVPLTEDTRHLMNGERLRKMKDGTVLVNISRGAIVDTDALTEQLPRFCGAVLDVFEDEPLDKESPLWDMDNVIITPHNSFVGENNSTRLFDVIIKNISDG